MAETLIHSNRCAAAFLCLAAAVPAGLGGALLIWGRRIDEPIISWTGWGLVAIGLLCVWRQLTLFVLPRLVLGRNHLFVFVRGIWPWRIPLDDVECFFIGQAPSALRVAHPTGGRVESVTVVIRLSERATDCHKRRTNLLLAKWSDGYVTLFGTWCEPLDGDFVNHMNRRLAEVKRSRKQRLKDSPT